MGGVCVVLLLLVLGTCAEPYDDIDFKTLRDARYQVPPCTLASLLQQATEHYDLCHGLGAPGRWSSATCHIPSATLLSSPDPWYALRDTLERSLYERYQDPVFIPTCNGGWWPAYGGLADFSCSWQVPWAYGEWNQSRDRGRYRACLYRKYDNALTRMLCGW
jgi:hypothetical protein